MGITLISSVVLKKWRELPWQLILFIHLLFSILSKLTGLFSLKSAPKLTLLAQPAYETVVPLKIINISITINKKP